MSIYNDLSSLENDDNALIDSHSITFLQKALTDIDQKIKVSIKESVNKYETNHKTLNLQKTSVFYKDEFEALRTFAVYVKQPTYDDYKQLYIDELDYETMPKSFQARFKTLYQRNLNQLELSVFLTFRQLKLEKVDLSDPKSQATIETRVLQNLREVCPHVKYTDNDIKNFILKKIHKFWNEEKAAIKYNRQSLLQRAINAHTIDILKHYETGKEKLIDYIKGTLQMKELPKKIDNDVTKILIEIQKLEKNLDEFTNDYNNDIQSGFVTSIMSKSDFWENLKLKPHSVAFDQVPYNKIDKGLQQLLVHADTPPVAYAETRVIKELNNKYKNRERDLLKEGKIEGLETVGALTIPGVPADMLSCKDGVKAIVDETVAMQYDIIGSKLANTIVTNELYEQVLKEVMPIISFTLRAEKAKKDAIAVENKLEEKELDQNKLGDKKYLEQHLGAYLEMIKKQESLSFDSACILIERYIEKKNLTEQLVKLRVFLEDNGNQKKHNVLGGVTETAKEYARKVWEAKGSKAQLTELSKVNGPLALLASLVHKIKGIAEKKKEFFDAPSASRGLFEMTGDTLAGALMTITDIFTGAGVILAAVGVVDFYRQAKKAYKFYKESRARYKDNAEELENYNKLLHSKEKIKGVRVKNMVELEEELALRESRAISLGLAKNNELKRFITCCVEMLKRIGSIIAFIFKLLGVTYLVGLSVSLVNTTINLCQNLWYLGRAVYKHMKGTKGVLRRATTEQFIQDFFKGYSYVKGIFANTQVFGEPKTQAVLKDKNMFNLNNKQAKSIISSEKEQEELIKSLNESTEIEDKTKLMALEKALNDDLFKRLASKPKPELHNLMFPGTGWISNVMAQSSAAM